MMKVIAFDADDTLWANEHYFQETEHRFSAFLEDFLPQHTVSKELLQTEISNLPLYGYGIKGFMLSMVETAIRVSNGTIDAKSIEQIIGFGKEMLEKPVELLDGVEDVLRTLYGKYRLVVATKGDLLDQERKLKKSGLEHYFHHIEIMSEKDMPTYTKLIRHLDVVPAEFTMIGNSLKSDILPVLELGGHGIHVPYHVTWAMEHVEANVEHANFRHVMGIRDVLNYL